jgi:polyhydroxyalkanoate synthase
VSTYRTTALYRYRSDRREHTVPVLLAFALINRPDVFDLRPCDSFVEQLLDEGFDVYPRDWGVPDDEDADRGLDRYVCNELAGASSRRCSSGQDEIALLGWWIGATVCHALRPRQPGRAQPRSADRARRDARLALRALDRP